MNAYVHQTINNNFLHQIIITNVGRRRKAKNKEKTTTLEGLSFCATVLPSLLL